MPGFDRGSSEYDRQHRLADAGRPDEQDVGGVVEEAEGGQVTDEFLIDAGLGREVEVIELSGVVVKKSCKVAVYDAADVSGRSLRFALYPGCLLFEVIRYPVGLVHQ
ncbi:hypothetical protein ACGFYU_02785 [Streptomyces sp. NPDC048337]|uniref:hypothetical protein n=1 Tax=Streptomyces sp. NPDC048337 TaxID=3365535 RepID=UPI00371E2307